MRILYSIVVEGKHTKSFMALTSFIVQHNTWTWAASSKEWKTRNEALLDPDFWNGDDKEEPAAIRFDNKATMDATISYLRTLCPAHIFHPGTLGIAELNNLPLA